MQFHYSNMSSHLGTELNPMILTHLPSVFQHLPRFISSLSLSYVLLFSPALETWHQLWLSSLTSRQSDIQPVKRFKMLSMVHLEGEYIYNRVGTVSTVVELRFWTSTSLVCFTFQEKENDLNVWTNTLVSPLNSVPFDANETAEYSQHQHFKDL